VGNTGGAGGSNAIGSDAGTGVTAKCDKPVGPGLPQGAPTLQAGAWVNVSPAGIPFNPAGANATFTQGMAVDPCNPAVLYLAIDSFNVPNGGLYKSINAGGSWTRIGNVRGLTTPQLDEPIRIRIDPKDTQHLYVGDGVRGASTGFWVSTDGGENFTMPRGFADAYKLVGQSSISGMFDVYDVAVDPTDFKHIVLSFHSPWDWDDYAAGAGLLESKDGGETWTAHSHRSGLGQGHSIHFLYQPELGIGNNQTWLWGTQSAAGMRRTTDGGTTWTNVTTEPIAHGGGTIYYTAKGTLYASSNVHNIKSTDNGVTWTSLKSPGSTALMGDGEKLYTGQVGGGPIWASSEADDTAWSNFNGQTFAAGPFEFGIDRTNRILYNASWGAGIWALKLP
jgi:hypothetical protein